jgi:hypothetical protein
MHLISFTAPAAPTASPSIMRTPEEVKARKQYFKHRKMMKNSGPLLNTFDLSAIQKPTSLVNIKDFSFIASYNWSISDDPVIFVPGISSFQHCKSLMGY